MRIVEFTCNDEFVDYSLSTQEGTKKLKLNSGFIKAKEIIDIISVNISQHLTIVIEKTNEELKYSIMSSNGINPAIFPSEVRIEDDIYEPLIFTDEYDVLKGVIALENIDGLKQSIIEEIYYATKSKNFRIEFQLQQPTAEDFESMLNRINEQIQNYQTVALLNINKTSNFIIEAYGNVVGKQKATYSISNISLENKIKSLQDAFSLLKNTSNVFCAPVIRVYSKEKEIRDLISRILKSYSKKSTKNSVFKILKNDEFDRLSFQESIKNDGEFTVIDYVPLDYVASMISLPTKSLPGFQTNKYVDFGSNDYLSSNDKVVIGNLVKKQKMETKIHIDIRDIAKHILVAGVTGSGKTTTAKSILMQLYDKEIPFLIFEPAKTEYRSLKNEISDLEIYRLGVNDVNNFQINTFEFEEKINLQTHMDYLKSVFIAAFPMYGPMPYILEQAFYKIYEDYGWDFISGKNIYQSKINDRSKLFPTMSDLYNAIDKVTDAVGYSTDTQSDVKGALKVRIGSLITGAKGRILNSRTSINIEKLLKTPTVLELENIGDSQEKIFLMGMILIKIYEYYISKGKHRTKLVNLLLIEEAHRLLENVNSNNNNEVADMKGKAMELFNDILSEVRTYGQGIMVAEQIPSKISKDVIKNTNLKIIHRLYAEDDRTVLSKSIGLSNKQSESIIKLTTGRAVIFHDKLSEPVMIDIPLNNSVLASNDNMNYSFEEKSFDEYEYLLSSRRYHLVTSKMIGSFLIKLDKQQLISSITEFVNEEFNNISLEHVDYDLLTLKTLVRFINNEGKHFFFRNLIELIELENEMFKYGIDTFVFWLGKNIKKLYREIDIFSEYSNALRFLESIGFIEVKRKIEYRNGITQSNKINSDILNKSDLVSKINISMFSEQEICSLCDAVMILLLEDYLDYFDEYFEIHKLLPDDISKYSDDDNFENIDNKNLTIAKDVVEYNQQIDKLITMQNEILNKNLTEIKNDNFLYEKMIVKSGLLIKLLVFGQISIIVAVILVLLKLFLGK